MKDEFFLKINDPYLKNNKDGKRPFYYCVHEMSETREIYWMIPLSSRIEKYQAIIAEKIGKHKPCDGLYICKLPNGKESAFLIQDIFPVLEQDVEREYTLGQNHLILPYHDDVTAIEAKVKKVISLVKRGIKLTPTSPDVLNILAKLTR